MDLCRNELPADVRADLTRAMTAAFVSLSGIRLAYLFGTFTRGEPFGDVDVAIVADDRSAWRVPAHAAQQLWIAMGKPPFDVDVVVLNDATPTFRRFVLAQGKLLFERESGDAMSYWLRTSHECLDFAERKLVLDREAAHGAG
jgi:predicted nucleotidyltransferase